LQYDGFKFNYSDTALTNDELWIMPHGLLHETGIQQQDITCFEWNGLKAFFATQASVPFDVLAASFYLLSRYEEYLPYEPDMYGRFPHTASVAYKEGFLDLPLVNLWWKKIKQQFPLLPLTASSFTFLPTYDIDIAYAYHGHSMVRNIAMFFRDFLKGDIDKVTEQSGVFSGKQKDPLDTYDFLHTLHHQFRLKPIYFFLVAESRKQYDKNLSPFSQAMQKLIKQHAAKYTIGIHPSWQSGDDDNLLKEEIQLLQKAAAIKITAGRQHYIRMKLPVTYRRLLDHSIADEYSMGYGSINGFRASYCLPYQWYDVEKEAATSLTIHPFCYMEANSFFEQKLHADQAAQELQQYNDVVRYCNGQLITIFHNHFLTTQTQWLPWRNMYENFLEKNFG